MLNKLLKNKNKSQKTREKSRGRSMVEMLGVLAIIGVLSIGGIQGYSIAMRKYQTNEILTALNKYATILYSSCLSAQANGDEEETLIVNRNGNGEKEVLNCPKPISFLSAGIGGYPKGLIRMGEDVITDGGPDILRTNSGDIVRIRIEVESQELCKSIMTTAGITPVAGREGWYDWDCAFGGTSGYPKGLIVSFIMN